jgi:hypothetical protein
VGRLECALVPDERTRITLAPFVRVLDLGKPAPHEIPTTSTTGSMRVALIARMLLLMRKLAHIREAGRRAGAAPSLWQGRPQRWMSIRLRQETTNAIVLALDS